MAWSKLKMDEVTVRRTALLKLRREGVRYDDDRVGALGYSSPSDARKDFHRALEAHRAEEAAEVGIYRQQENERLDALLEAAWPRATQPSPVFDKDGEVIDHALDLRAVDTVIRLIDRRAKLNGLDMPVKAEVSGPGGGALQIGAVGLAELRNLINTAGDPDPDDEEGLLDDTDDDDADDDSNDA
ncbi:hypothetical protein [Streptomyces caniscabiei]|uniref:hypothetical protein n=1 Tax=Streptomyces caniscabiei TaxID=2746961 RepID=UPI0018726780|nr:hypothetical protein [Streptomyces caniscabiei]MBE4761732.1 hypothetical protein [Streptomyces caniscabiei]